MLRFAFDDASALALKLAAMGRKYQKSTDLLLRKAPFARLVREFAMDFKARVPPALARLWNTPSDACSRFRTHARPQGRPKAAHCVDPLTLARTVGIECVRSSAGCQAGRAACKAATIVTKNGRKLSIAEKNLDLLSTLVYSARAADVGNFG